MSCKNDINIAGRKIGPNHSPFIIAEMSGNHNNAFVKVGFSEGVISTVGTNLMHSDSMRRRK